MAVMVIPLAILKTYCFGSKNNLLLNESLRQYDGGSFSLMLFYKEKTRILIQLV